MQSVPVVFIASLLLGASGMQLERERPVQKVIGMLNDMKANLETEAKADEEMYEKMTCYCDSTKAEKTKSIADAEARITELTALIEEMTAKSSTLSTEIATLKEEVADNTAALGKATDIRTKEAADFTEDEANMNEGIEGLTGAVDALGKTQAFVQKPKPLSFLQQAPTSSGSYAPQSGAIFGILKQMKEGFETNLQDAVKEEGSAQATFNELKSSKTDEINSGEATIASKEGEKADADERASNAKTDLAETRASLAADSETLANTKTQCDNFAAEYAERTKTRTEETAVVGEVIGMLTDDDAHDLFSKTYAFTQTRMLATSRRLSKASQTIMATGRKWNRPSMVALAISMRGRAGLDSFGNVKAKVQAMIDDLMAEKKEEVKVADKCRADLKKNGDDTEAATEQKEQLETTIADLTNTISNLKDAIATLNAEIAEARIDMKRASEDREAENKEFQQTVADQRATQAILNKALTKLKSFYEAKAVFMQQPAGMNFGGGYKKSAGSGGVMAVLEGVIKEAANLEKDALKAEQDAQTAYEVFITDSNASVETKQKDIASKTELKGQKEGELVGANGDLKGNGADLASLGSIASGLHTDCDFLLNNYDIRQEARDNEVESLKMAIAMLSGADFR